MPDTKWKFATTPAEEVILEIETRIAINIGRTHVDRQLRALGIDIELVPAALEEIAIDRDGGGDKPVRVAGIISVVGEVNARLGVEFDNDRRVWDRNKSAVLRIESQIER